MSQEPPSRPDPDRLLERIRADQSRAERAKLKVFFGFAPGVGKTYRMLQVARELVDQRVDVAVGAVETHGRYDTGALTLGLEILPKRTFEHRGRQLEELDLDAALKRRPQVLLLDELAHTNAPGARHAKRWQDVVELLDAGIDVYTTLNVQHVESLNDVVAQITSVQVRETVPDSILERADEIELVDIAPEELLTRLNEGKVYLPDQIARAASGFFQRGNLLALRELALRRTAERVDADVLAWREQQGVDATWATSERIMVCVGPAPASARLIRAGRRIAAGLRAPWTAVWVDALEPARMSEADRARLEQHLKLAESLGAQVVRLAGASVGEALLGWARKSNVTRLLIGKPTHSRLWDRLKGSLLDEVVRGSGDIDVQVISGDSDLPAEPRRAPPQPDRVVPAAWAGAVGLVAVTTLLSLAVRAVLPLPDLEMLYLLAIIICAVRFGRGPAVLSAALSVVAYDFFFVPPSFTLVVADGRYVLTFAMMFGVGIIASTVAARIRRQEREAIHREERTRALFALSRELGTTATEAEVSSATARHFSQAFDAPVVVLLTGTRAEPDPVHAERSAEGAQSKRAGAGNSERRSAPTQAGDLARPSTSLRVSSAPLPPTAALSAAAAWPQTVTLDAAALGVAQWVSEHGRLAGQGTDTLPGARALCVPLRSTSGTLGVVTLLPRTAAALTQEQRELLDALCAPAAGALERARLAAEAQASAFRAKTEQMRSSLLSAVSHDLRTPLAAITGAATTLSDTSAVLPEPQRAELIQSITDEAERLERLVGNLLDMTRLESGGLTPKREWVPLDELVGSALNRLESKLEGRAIAVELAPDLPLLHVDPVLFEQVLINLLENAAKHTPAATPLELRARLEGDALRIELSDRGPGLPPGAGERIFEKFFRGNNVGAPGAGLGLPICQGIVEAHGGRLTAFDRDGGGATFRIELPRPNEPPP